MSAASARKSRGRNVISRESDIALVYFPSETDSVPDSSFLGARKGGAVTCPLSAGRRARANTSATGPPTGSGRCLPASARCVKRAAQQGANTARRSRCSEGTAASYGHRLASLPRGSESDWSGKNAVAAGGCETRTSGKRCPAVAPQVRVEDDPDPAPPRPGPAAAARRAAPLTGDRGPGVTRWAVPACGGPSRRARAVPAAARTGSATPDRPRQPRRIRAPPVSREPARLTQAARGEL